MTLKNRSASDPNTSVNGWFGDYKELGKTEARQEFLRLLNDLRDEHASVAITDRGEKVAVIMGYKHYQALIAVLNNGSREKLGTNPLSGAIKKVGNLKQSSKEIKALFEQSTKRFNKSL
jgi:prevent-host-death family protein